MAKFKLVRDYQYNGKYDVLADTDDKFSFDQFLCYMVKVVKPDFICFHVEVENDGRVMNLLIDDYLFLQKKY